jgi:hypothetical protein
MRAVAIASLIAVAACGPNANPHEEECDPACTGSDVCVAGECTDDPGEACDPGDSEACYSGYPGTEGVGPCQGGTRTCAPSGYWGPCEGEVVPEQDMCGNNQDEDCDGTADNETDEDGDGYTNCTGDCCDSTAEGCTAPERVNPGAFEAPGNELDDDCDGNVDNSSAATCDQSLASNSANAEDYARAIDICQTATPGHWGVVSAKFTKADGTGAPLDVQRAIRTDWGSTGVQLGNALAVLSTAHAATPTQNNPAYSDVNGTDHGVTSGYPADWFSANGNALPNAPGCPAPIAEGAFDPVMFELKLRAPTNAQSFSMKINFMSAEFPEYVCTFYNDFFVVLLDSGFAGTPANPADGNLAFYQNAAGERFPVGVNLASGDTGLFTVCRNGPTGCSGTNPGTINTCGSDQELTGTGFDAPEAFGGCSANDQTGGGTGWLQTSGNVVPGEEITLRIGVWDTSDGILDSTALIDAFQWSIDPSDPGTIIVD